MGCAPWVVDELAPHLPLELDFVHEAANLERCKRFVEGSASLRRRVALPEVLPHLSSRRVLTMTFEAGCSVTVPQTSKPSCHYTLAVVTTLYCILYLSFQYNIA